MFKYSSRAPIGALALIGMIAAGCTGGSDGPTAIELPIGRIEITQGCSVLIIDGTCQLIVAAFADDGRRIVNPVLRFSSSSGSVSVSQTGRVRGVAPGTATIFVSASSGSAEDSTRVTVIPDDTK